MRVRRLVLPVFGLLAAAAACSSFTADQGAEIADAGFEASDDVTVAPRDTGTTVDASDASDAGPVDLLVSPGFEDGCGKWGFKDSKTQPTFEQITTIVHGGTYACKVCATGTGGLFTISQTVARTGNAGAVVSGSVWVHANGDAGGGLDAPTTTAITSDGLEQTLEFFNGPGPKVDGTWKLASTGLITTTPFAHVQLRFSATAPAAGYCFVVDDAVLTVTDP